MDADGDRGATRGSDVEFWVANEFASCRLRQVPFGNGSRIEIHSERSGATILLDAMALDALTRLGPEEISGLVTIAVERRPIDDPRSR